MVLQKPVGTTRLENAEIFRKVRKTTFSRSPPGQSLCQWRQKGVSRPNWGGVAVDFHDAQLENQTSDRLRIGVNLLVTNSSIDCESFISGLSSPLIFFFYSWAMRRVYLLFASRALCLMFFFLGSTLNSGAHARTKHSTQSGVFVHFFLLFFFLFFFFFIFSILPAYSQSSVTVVCVLRASSCWWKKSDSPTPCVFAVVTVYPYIMYSERMFELLRRHAQIHEENRTRQVPPRTPSVV